MFEVKKAAAVVRDESLAQPVKVPAKVYGVMAVTTVLTFATLMTGYQLLFPPQSLFA